MARKVNIEKGKKGFQPTVRGATPPSTHPDYAQATEENLQDLVDYDTLYARFEVKNPTNAQDVIDADFDARVRALENEGIPTSDAQAIVEAEDWIQQQSRSDDDPAEQAMNATLAYLNSHDPDRRKEHGNPSRTDLWRYAHMELAELAPQASLQARDEAAEIIADACTKDLQITKAGGASTILDNDEYLHAADRWDLTRMNSRLQELVHTHATDKENDIYDATVEKVAERLNVDTDDAADVVWNAAREANMCHWQYDEAHLVDGKQRAGILSNPTQNIPVADAVKVLRRCHRGDHVAIDTPEDLDAVTSLLSDRGLWHGFPLKLKLSDQAASGINARLADWTATDRKKVRDLLDSSHIQ